MAEDDRKRWDRRHRAAEATGAPSKFLTEVFQLAAWPMTASRALDLACGSGRNALYLAERGFDVAAIDVSPVALEQGRRSAVQKRLSIDWQQADLETTRLPESAYDLIICFNYLQRSLFAQIKSALAVGGYAIIETYLTGQQNLGRPTNPAYLLGYNELLQAFAGFRILWYREGRFSDGGEPAYRAGIVAQKFS